MKNEANKAILHLIPDEKIADNLIDNFSAFKGQVFYIYKVSDKSYVTVEGNNIYQYKGETLNLLKKRHDFEAIVVHGNNQLIYKLLTFFKKKDERIVWICWGGDVYNLEVNQKNLYFSLTQQFVSSRIKKDFLPIQFLKWGKKTYWEILQKIAFSKITHFATYVKEDYEYFCDLFPQRYQFIHFNPCSIEQYISSLQQRVNENAEDILIGNSISAECNHLEAMYNIKPYVGKSKVYVPLNYGADIEYKNFVLKEGKKILEENFVPLMDFINRDDYVQLLNSCSVGIFNHRRQQAMGNILAMLYLGTRVYLSESNPIYNYFIRNEFKIFSLENDYQVYKNKKLEGHFAENNRQQITRLFNDKVISDSYRLLLEEIMN